MTVTDDSRRKRVAKKNLKKKTAFKLQFHVRFSPFTNPRQIQSVFLPLFLFLCSARVFSFTFSLFLAVTISPSTWLFSVRVIMDFGGGRKRSRHEAASFNGNGGFKKSKPGSFSHCSQLFLPIFSYFCAMCISVYVSWMHQA